MEHCNMDTSVFADIISSKSDRIFELEKQLKENTATMYTHSEVLKIAEYVKKSAAEIAIMANHNEDAHNTILRIDVNQFIPKK